MKTILFAVSLIASLAVARAQYAGCVPGFEDCETPAVVYWSSVVYQAPVVYCAPVYYAASAYMAPALTADCCENYYYTPRSSVVVIGEQDGTYSYSRSCIPRSSVVSIGDRPGSWWY